ncbi:uncharacterized protein TEOVI_000528900 [Trypanosoma equiperdum]|uniref:T. brucei spp.-specific protein n=2 Tax=Trypanozoon TaxID=39700 RepID=Q57XS2_TRYB2|nr:hypothetical protein Tb927.7.7020 [Trypanosoma brucei brucei TREU927]AAX69597.1 hypothetical protein Tb927.7.7020 [Trypanosoma brucei]AAZ12763.1 hypothetical protein Tb927.7.7020 [Trypanosoma brucei brucei TREU927]SCU64527.1 hypothetical protein, conserved [Trypanosoma equiperdum]
MEGRRSVRCNYEKKEKEEEKVKNNEIGCLKFSHKVYKHMDINICKYLFTSIRMCVCTCLHILYRTTGKKVGVVPQIFLKWAIDTRMFVCLLMQTRNLFFFVYIHLKRVETAYVRWDMKGREEMPHIILDHSRWIYTLTYAYSDPLCGTHFTRSNFLTCTTKETMRCSCLPVFVVFFFRFLAAVV